MPASLVRPRVLIVDDEHLIADTLALILNRQGFDARAVYSGEEAVAAATSLSPDILISDVIMGGMTGIEAAILISECAPECRILLISGQAATTDLVHLAAGKGHVFEILPKPIHPQALLKCLNDGL
jgi:CheY-like chemotaxis protein